MRHRKKDNHLGRTVNHRRALLSNLAVALIRHKRIRTTLAKAKALRRYVEPLVTRSKNDTQHSRRIVFSYLRHKEAVTELFREIGPKVAERPGGYTRIIRLENRTGDNAPMAFIEFVDYNTLYTKESKTTGRKRTRRSSKKGSTKTGTASNADQVVPSPPEETGTTPSTTVENLEEGPSDKSEKE
ncbi:MAG: 50S ribosomal protein L17 [Flavobacteriales bacterium]|nr:50S ribosomal protein L17 [Flavobacteriales bacterium]MCX7768017.1 50S ribosomal protein L17 [Flavobacteriales bacterium]MDW8409222.1 50S ribosomal protein L17 [Flavobacteriales bacterium]